MALDLSGTTFGSVHFGGKSVGIRQWSCPLMRPKGEPNVVTVEADEPLPPKGTRVDITLTLVREWSTGSYTTTAVVVDPDAGTLLVHE